MGCAFAAKVKQKKDEEKKFEKEHKSKKKNQGKKKKKPKATPHVRTQSLNRKLPLVQCYKMALRDKYKLFSIDFPN